MVWDKSLFINFVTCMSMHGMIPVNLGMRSIRFTPNCFWNFWMRKYEFIVEKSVQPSCRAQYRNYYYCHFRAKLLKSYPNSRKSSPSRTPLKRGQDKYRSFLEVTLRPDRKLADDEVLCVNEKDTRPATLPVSVDENNETSVWQVARVCGMDTVMLKECQYNNVYPVYTNYL